jgi:hypothetical protein
MPASPAELVDDVVVGVVDVVDSVVVEGVTVSVVVLADGGSANDVWGVVPVSLPPKTSIDARIKAIPRSRSVAAARIT